MVINCGNPVVSGPDGAKLDAALAQLDLLVAIDFVQRESHRHAHWLLPAAHWLERNDLLAFTSNMHDEPYVQYGRQGRRAAAGRAREEWRIFIDLAIAMRKPLFGAKGVNGFIKATRGLAARLTRRPALEFSPHWIDRLAGGDRHESSTGAGSNGATSWPIRTGWCWARASSGISAPRCAPTTRRCTPRRRSSSRGPANCSPGRLPNAPDGYPFQLANRRHRHSMNSWLNELPGLHPGGKGNDVVIHPEDAADARRRRRRSRAGLLPGRARSS